MYQGHSLPAVSEGYSVPERHTGFEYKIYGAEMQFVEIQLGGSQSVVAEAGAMMYKSSSVHLDTIFGDGRKQGVFGKLVGAGKRMFTGEGLFNTMFRHEGRGIGRVAFSAPYPGTIIGLKLSDYGGSLICQKDSFLAAQRGVAMGIYFQKKILTALFGGEGFVMQKLSGDGIVFVHAGGALVQRRLKEGEEFHCDTGALAAMTEDVSFDLKRAGGIKTMLFGGEGLFLAKLRGPGTIWLQSMPISRLAGRLHQARFSNRGDGAHFDSAD